MKTVTQHIHIGIEPDYRLYNKLWDMSKAVDGMNISQEEKDARNEELCHLSVLCNRPRFDDDGKGFGLVYKKLDALKHRYYPEYTFER